MEQSPGGYCLTELVCRCYTQSGWRFCREPHRETALANSHHHCYLDNRSIRSGCALLWDWGRSVLWCLKCHAARNHLSPADPTEAEAAVCRGDTVDCPLIGCCRVYLGFLVRLSCLQIGRNVGAADRWRSDRLQCFLYVIYPGHRDHRGSLWQRNRTGVQEQVRALN